MQISVVEGSGKVRGQGSKVGLSGRRHWSPCQVLDLIRQQ